MVTKVPRFAFEKFPGADPRLTTSMKSVGEAMALGGNFQESLGKAMRSIDKRHMGFSWDGDKPDEAEVAELLKAITVPTEHRYLQIQRALWGGATERQIFDATKIDPWFVKQLALINQTAMEVRDAEKLTAKLLKKAKLAGLSDLQIAHLRNLGDEGENTIRELRWTYGLRPVYKTVDTCAAEFDAVTPYYYSCYADETELRKRDREAVIILGSGPNRIGQGIEFDYTCVHAVQELGKDYDTIMVNCNPETVSTDYDMSNRLYFEPLTFEDVLEIYEAEKKMGPVGGRHRPARRPDAAVAGRATQGRRRADPGHHPESIDLAENRELFGEVLRREHMNAPRYGTRAVARRGPRGRPQHRLSGARAPQLRPRRTRHGNRLRRRPVDQVRQPCARRGQRPTRSCPDACPPRCSSTSSCRTPSKSTWMPCSTAKGCTSAASWSTSKRPACTPAMPHARCRRARCPTTRSVAFAKAPTPSPRAAVSRGLINVQYAFMANTLYVIEANPRASRTVPFASKATGVALAKAAARIMAGGDHRRSAGQRPAAAPRVTAVTSTVAAQVAIKGVRAAVQALPRPSARPSTSCSGPEMRSTGEVMGFDRDFPHAFAKSQLAAYDGGLPTSGNVFISVNDTDKRQLPLMAVRLVELGFSIWATEGTASVLRRYGIDSKIVDKIQHPRRL